VRDRHRRRQGGRGVDHERRRPRREQRGQLGERVCWVTAPSAPADQQPRPRRGLRPRASGARSRRAGVRKCLVRGRSVTRPPPGRPGGPGRTPAGRPAGAGRPARRSPVSGRSEMSSPGKASWCIAVRRSPGSTAHTRTTRLLDAEDAGQLVDRGLGRAVTAPPLVRFDRGVRGDHDQRTADCAQGGQRELGEADRREHVHLVHVAQRLHRIGGQRGLRARTEDAGVVDDQGKRTEVGRGGEPVRARWAGAVMSPAIATTSAAATPGPRPGWPGRGRRSRLAIRSRPALGRVRDPVRAIHP
jgi:hypothetical protein